MHKYHIENQDAQDMSCAFKDHQSEGNQIIGCEALYSQSFLTATLSMPVLPIPSYLVTDFKLLVHSGSLLLACFFSFDVQGTCRIQIIGRGPEAMGWMYIT